MKTLTFSGALCEALHEEMERDESVFVMGEDVITHGGPYKVTDGIAERFPERIFETPIAEAGIVGLGVGAAMAGMSPVVEIMYMDFVTCAMDEVVNQAAKMRYMTGGPSQRSDGYPASVRRRSIARGAAFADYGIVVYARARLAGGRAFHAERRQGIAQIRGAQPGPGTVFRVQANLHLQGRGAGWGAHRAHR